MKLRRRTMFKTAILLTGSYAALVGLTKLGYRKVLYPAPRRGFGDGGPPGGELRTFDTADGERVIAACYGPSTARVTLVHFHGNGEVIADSVDLATVMVRRGLRFVAVEYRGYGDSPADAPHEAGLYADAEAVLRGLQAEGAAIADITLWGSSLGSGVAVEMAARGHCGRLILQAPYTSIPDVAARHVPFLPMRMLMADRFANLSKAAELRLPTLIIHGDADSVVPYDMGVTLSKVIAGAELITVQGGSHNDLFAREPERLLDAIDKHANPSGDEASVQREQSGG